jgi:hypothetical protein
MHPYYFVDLISLLVSLAAFVAFASRCGVTKGWSALLFVLAAAADPVLLEQWVVPWTTTPLAAALWVLLALAAAHIEGRRRPFLLGVFAVCLPILRPTDLLLTLPALLACLLVDLQHRRLRWRDVGSFAVAVLIPAGLYLLLHIRIYGFAPSLYMTNSADIGFTLHRLGWKAYIILVDPRPWIGGGEGLIRRAPWLILGIAGLVTALQRPITAMLAVTLLLHSVLYLSYVDLLPTGFWRYLNVHYWTWSFPGWALLGVLLLRDLRQPAHRRLAAGSVVVVMLLLCVRLVPRPAIDGESVEALDYPMPATPTDSVYFTGLTIHDDLGTLNNIAQIRAIQMPNAVRVLTLTRPIHGAVTTTSQGLDAITPIRLHENIGFGMPFGGSWKRADEYYGPR